MKGSSKMPNEGGKSSGASGSKTNTGSCSGLKKSNEMRSDVTKAPSSKNPYPKGMS